MCRDLVVCLVVVVFERSAATTTTQRDLMTSEPRITSDNFSLQRNIYKTVAVKQIINNFYDISTRSIIPVDV